MITANPWSHKNDEQSSIQHQHAVVIVGGGPTGLMLAGELALARVDVAIVERRESRDLVGLRAGGLHIRTIELLDQRGIVDRFVSQGQVFQITPFADVLLDTSDLLTRHSYYLQLWQIHTERNPRATRKNPRATRRNQKADRRNPAEIASSGRNLSGQEGGPCPRLWCNRSVQITISLAKNQSCSSGSKLSAQVSLSEMRGQGPPS